MIEAQIQSVPGKRKGVAPTIRKLHDKYPDLTPAQIARRVGCSAENVTGVLRTYLGNSTIEELREFQETKPDIYDSLQSRMLASITESKIAKTNVMSLVTASAILEDKARVIRGQATGINVNVLMDVVEAIRAKQGK